jgi:hypothetical protein
MPGLGRLLNGDRPQEVDVEEQPLRIIARSPLAKVRVEGK